MSANHQSSPSCCPSAHAPTHAPPRFATKGQQGRDGWTRPDACGVGTIDWEGGREGGGAGVTAWLLSRTALRGRAPPPRGVPGPAHIIEALWVSTPATVTGRWRAPRLNNNVSCVDGRHERVACLGHAAPRAALRRCRRRRRRLLLAAQPLPLPCRGGGAAAAASRGWGRCSATRAPDRNLLGDRRAQSLKLTPGRTIPSLLSCLNDAPWLVKGGHGASLMHHKDHLASSPPPPRRRRRPGRGRAWGPPTSPPSGVAPPASPGCCRTGARRRSPAGVLAPGPRAAPPPPAASPTPPPAPDAAAAAVGVTAPCPRPPPPPPPPPPLRRPRRPRRPCPRPGRSPGGAAAPYPGGAARWPTPRGAAESAVVSPACACTADVHECDDRCFLDGRQRR
jgi:hypothetical protein